MKLAAMQPYFFPYIGYFSLIDSVDEFVFFDSVQFVKKTWMSRNRILKPSLKDFQYINIGLKGETYMRKMKECYLNEDNEWKVLIFRQIEHYKRKAPFYLDTIGLLENILDSNFKTLNEFNINSTIEICNYLSINSRFLVSSKEKRPIRMASHPGEWGLILSQLYQADHYINAPGGESFYKTDEFIESNIKLGFLKPKLDPYFQGINNSFIPALSIIDVLMFNHKDDVKEMVKSYSIDWKN